ncbi:MAG: sulfatase [bacterium]
MIRDAKQNKVMNRFFEKDLSRRDVLKYGLYGGLAAGIPGSLFLDGCESHRSVKRPNIFLITVDTLRADHLGCYGYPKDTSPSIDRFASNALLFENCFSNASETWSSCASILSGFLPHETKAIERLSLPMGAEILPIILKSLGYKTVGVVSNYILRKKSGWAQGFTIYDDSLEDREVVRDWPERIAEHTTDRAIELIEQFHKEPLFMWIHYQDPHGPYTPPDNFAKKFRNPGQKPFYLEVNKTLSGFGGIPSYQRLGENRDFYYYVSGYDGEIRYHDEHFKRLTDTLNRFGLFDDAMIIFTSDHGEAMGGHNYYFAHGENLYNSVTHVPLIIKYSSKSAGRRTDFVQHIDIVPTILKMLNLETDLRFRGRNLLEKSGGESEIFAEVKSLLVKDEFRFSIIMDGFKLIHTPGLEKTELFDLRTDPEEQNDLIAEEKHRDRAKDLQVRLARLQGEDLLHLNLNNKPQKLTDEEKEKLKSLGYVFDP